MIQMVKQNKLLITLVLVAILLILIVFLITEYMLRKIGDIDRMMN